MTSAGRTWVFGAGRTWVFGDDIDTDVLAPGQYMKGPIGDLAAHCLEAVDPAFARNVAAGDVVIGGTNFGVGSSREQAAQALKTLGVSAVIAKSFAGIFYRNAINLGLPVLVSQDIDTVQPGDAVTMDLDTATLTLTDRGMSVECEPLPDFLRTMIRDGGLVPHLEKKLKGEKSTA